jgi:alkanesulfonate monooxygenase SsuD/methylene tetrahydromethanopterin reductase-like flavin-dependent oxidoreductase (luciferase family)
LTETRTEEQTEIWKNELAIAMADEQWRLALKLCSWLRYILGQQELPDPEVEQAQRQAKEGLAEQVIREKAQQEREERRRRLQRQAMYQILSGDWDRALDLIEALYQHGANRQEVIHLLQELKKRLPTMSIPEYRQRGQRVDELVERVGGGR